MTLMRVAFLLTQDRGGPVDVTVRLAAMLHDTGECEVRVFGPTPARDASLLGDRHEEVVVPGKGSLGAIRWTRSVLRAWRPDIVHAQDRRSGLVVAGMQRGRTGPRVAVHTYHGVPDDVCESWFQREPGAPGPSNYTKAVLAADALVARTVSRTVVPSSAMGDFLHHRLRVDRNRLAHIDNGVLLPTAAAPTGPVRKLLFVGLLVPRKGLLDLLTALGRQTVMPSDATLTVVGDGPERVEAERMASLPALAGRVNFLGFRSDVAAIMTAHDALVLPSRLEQQPLVIAEAMGAGKPVVATRTGGVPEMLTLPDAPNYLVPPGDVDALAASLQRLFDDPDPGGLGARLAARAAARYSAEACASSHLTLYRGLFT